MDCACSFFFLAVSVHSEIEPGQGGADRMGDLWKTYLALTNTLHEELDATENVPDALDM